MPNDIKSELESSRLKGIMSALEDFIDKTIRFEVEMEKKDVVGDMDDDGEDESIETSIGEHKHILRNAYIDNNPFPGWIFKSPSLKYFLVESDDRKLLVPVEYSYTPRIQPGWACETITYSLKRLIYDEKIILDISSLETSSVFDGYRDISGLKTYGHFLVQYPSYEFPRFPQLAEKGCVYNSKDHTISGSIEKLFAGLSPVWEE